MNSLGLDVIAGLGRGSKGRGVSIQNGTGRGTSVPPNLAPQYQQYIPLNTSHYNYNHGMDNLVTQQSYQIPQSNPMHSTIVTSSQTTGKSDTSSSKKLIDLLINIVDIMDKQNNTIKIIDDRTKNIEDHIRTLNNNIVTREYISELLKPLSILPDQDDNYNDDDNKALDAAMEKLSTITNVLNNDSDKNSN